MSVTFRAKLIASHGALALIVIVLVMSLFDRALNAILEREVDDRLEQQALGAAKWIGEAGYARTNQLAHRIAAIVQTEVTIFDRDGRILADSAGSSSEPILQVWPEIVEARRGKVGRATRWAARGMEPYHHVAVATQEGFILRLSAPLARIQSTFVEVQRRLWAVVAVAIATAAALAIVASRLVSLPLRAMTRAAARVASGDFDVRLPERPLDDMGRLARALNAMAAELQQRTVMRRDYLANLSHELRTPISAILGYAESILDGRPGPERSQQFLETIHRQAGRLASLVDELLVLADLEARPFGDVALEPVDVVAVAKGVSETLLGEAERDGIEIVVTQTGPVIALGDPEGIETVLQNLIDNAIRYGRRDGHVWVSVDRTGHRVTTTVADDGPGIAFEHLPRLFERFYRVDPARSRERGGAGLGLAIVKHHVERMGGSIRAESVVGRGSRFIFEIPERCAEWDGREPPAAHGPQSMTGHDRLGLPFGGTGTENDT